MKLSSSASFFILLSVLMALLLSVAMFAPKAKQVTLEVESASKVVDKPLLAKPLVLVSQKREVPSKNKQSHSGKPNRLIKEASPYLLQHAYNPIDWYPWGKEAFAKAKRENKPIFLSVGYSTCHWCHVMEEESFSQQDIADILNKYFVAIKVDRERRPDLDETYMMATQIITRTGGWPNNLFLTPDQKPFFAQGYLPKKDFASLLVAVNAQWQSPDKKELVKDGNKIYALVQKVMNRQLEAKKLDKNAIMRASRMILKTFDPFYGGFATAPKFPSEPTLMFLSRVAMRYGDKKALDAMKQTVDAILDGGIHDQVGGGFHRYAIDNAWLTPHFEKMLYNQAQMVRVLVRLYEMTGNIRYKLAAMRCLDFVLRDMTSPDGRFYSAYDADSKGGEGRYYTWSLDEMKTVLSPKEFDFTRTAFDMSESGNFEGSNILHFPDSPADMAKKLKMSEADFDMWLTKIRSKLLISRNKRQKPHLDKKIIASWNGMMITAFAEAGRVFGKPAYVRAGEKALQSIYTSQVLALKQGNILVRATFDGKGALPGQLADYASLSVAASSLYDALPAYEKRGRQWREAALFFIEHAKRLFLDKKQGDYYMTERHSLKKRDDSSVPSGNAIMLEALALASLRSQNQELVSQTNDLLTSLSGLMVRDPSGMTFALYAADLHLRGEAGVYSYGARGHVKLSAQQLCKVGFNVSLDIEKGWHVNGNKPLEDFFIPTSLSFFEEGKQKDVIMRYPVAENKELGFNSKPMALYEGHVAIGVEAKQLGRKMVSVKVAYQACSDKICLEPEEVVLRLFGGRRQSCIEN